MTKLERILELLDAEGSEVIQFVGAIVCDCEVTEGVVFAAAKRVMEGPTHSISRCGLFVTAEDLAWRAVVNDAREISIEELASIYAGLKSPVEILMVKEAREFVRLCIANLGLLYRQVIAFEYYGGMSHQEVADLLGVASSATIRARHFRAEETLREELENYGR